MNVSQWLRQVSLELAEHESARLDADLLMCYVLGCERTKLYAWPDRTLGADQLKQLDTLLDKRKLGYPIAYLTQKREFWSLDFDVNKAVLVPRPETELIVSLALQAMPSIGSDPILDAGTGSGVIATALSYQWLTDCTDRGANSPLVIASDCSSEALSLARQNANKHVPGRVRFVRSNWLDAFVDNSFGMIISNPPYLAKDDSHLNNKSLQHEPITALVSGDDGLDDIRVIISSACRAGKSGCYVLLEHGATQAAAVCRLMQEASYTNIQTHTDIAGMDRVSCGYCP